MDREHADIDARVRTLLTERLQIVGDGVTITEASSLADLGLDSTAILSLVVGLEEAFDIDIADAEINVANFGTIGSIGHYVARRLGR